MNMCNINVIIVFFVLGKIVLDDFMYVVFSNCVIRIVFFVLEKFGFELLLDNFNMIVVGVMKNLEI